MIQDAPSNLPAAAACAAAVSIAKEFEPGYSEASASAASLIFPFVGDKLLLGPDATLPTPEMLRELGAAEDAFVFGSLGGQVCELRIWPDASPIPAGCESGDYRRLYGRWPEAMLAALVRGKGLTVWSRDHRHCGRCGTLLARCTDEPARRCPACETRVYPRIAPVCMVVVIRDRELLLARSPHFPVGVYSALAGYIEAGESVEHCLRREVREEVGIAVRNLEWFGSQAWPYPSSLMLGFVAEHDAGEIALQENEIEDAQWFSPDRLPLLPHASSLACRLIAAACQRIAAAGTRQDTG